MRAWEACWISEKSRNPRNKGSINGEVVYDLLNFYIKDPPENATLSRLIQEVAFRAVWYGYGSILKLLLENEMIITTQDKDGRNLLHHAATSSAATFEMVCD